MAFQHPEEEYTQRLEANRKRFDRLQHWDDRYANVRLAFFALLVFCVWAAVSPQWIAPFWLAAPILLFGFLVYQHARVIEAKDRAQSLSEFYARALERVQDRWKGHGPQGLHYLPEHHVYARDLDLFGDASLFQLLCSAQTLAGEQRLAEWMCTPAPPDEIKRRHGAVEELRCKLQLREDMYLLGGMARAELHPQSIIAWSEDVPRPVPLGVRVFAICMSVVTVASFLLGLSSMIFALFALMLVLNLGVLAWYSKQIQRTSQEVTFPCRDLKVLAKVLARLEHESFEAPMLRSLQEHLKDHNTPASRAIALLDRRVELLETQRNPMFIPVAISLLWGIHFTHYIEQWRAMWGPQVRGWLGALGELEALMSLAQFAYERPDYPFPEICETEHICVGELLGHPLLPAKERICNNVKLDASCCMYMVSGSNMSGKSTFLRTVGINAVLAQMGAPVCAKSLRMHPFQIGATLHVQDSIQQGASRFYAEISRLKKFMDTAREGGVPLLFLLDEILHGTNSHDRSLGAEALLRGYLKLGAMGLVTTHDLAITQMVDKLGAPVKNVHFEDYLDGNSLHFDYLVKPGVVQKSNALDLMRSIGIDI